MPSLGPTNFPVYAKSLGTPLLSYILAIEEEEVANLLSTGGNITASQKAALDQVEQVLIQAKQGKIQNPTLEWHDTIALTSLRFQSGLPVFLGLRSIAGGDFTLKENCDPVKQALSEICMDYYPFTLLPERQDQFRFGSIDLPSMFGTEKLARFIAAVRNDTTLMTFFPEGADDDMSSSYHYATSFGIGGGVQLVNLHDNLIRSGIALMHARNESSMTSLQVYVWEMLDTLRASLTGEKTKLPVFDVFDLIGLPETFTCSLGSSRVMGLPKRFVRHVPKNGRPDSSSDGSVCGGMLERLCEFEVSKLPPDFKFPDHGPWPIQLTTDTDLQQRNLVALSTSLATQNEGVAAARWRATITIDPLNGVGKSWQKSSATLGMQHVMDSDECNSLTQRLTNIGSLNVQQIEMAIGRFLSATTRRDDHQDSLVDAVVGLENLFGSRAEISLSVASGVANLLGRDAAERKVIFKTAKDIYNARSALVHGNSKKTSTLDIPTIRISAIDLLKRSIWELLERRPNLLPLAGEDRVKELLLG